MSFIAVNILKMMFVFNLYELSALPVLLLRYLTDIMAHRFHLNQLFSILEIAVPFRIEWIGIAYNLDMRKGLNVVVEPDEGFTGCLVHKSLCTAFGATEVRIPTHHEHPLRVNVNTHSERR